MVRLSTYDDVVCVNTVIEINVLHYNVTVRKCAVCTADVFTCRHRSTQFLEFTD